MLASLDHHLRPSNLTIQQKEYLNAHLFRKIHNTLWLGRIVEIILDPSKNETEISQYFPYYIKPDSVATTIIQNISKSVHLGQPRFNKKNTCCVYLIAMPCIPDKEMKSYTSLQKVIYDIEEQALHESANKSLLEIGARVGMVVGLNTFYSMDSNRNDAFNTYCAQLHSLKIRTLPVKIVPFFWSPWKSSPSYSKELLFTVDKCYTMIRSYFSLVSNPTEKIKALDLSLNIEKYFGITRENPIKSLIPYQEIRTTVLHSAELTELSTLFFKHLPHHPQYVLSLDPDFISLKTDQLGLLSHYDQIIKRHYSTRNKLPSVMSTGYVAPEMETMGIIKWGIQLDRKIREAIAKTLPLAVYMPEPNFAFLLPSIESLAPFESLASFSFSSGAKSSMLAESRQFIKHAIKKQLIDPSEMTFINHGAVQTTIDEEWRTSTVRQYTTLTQKQIFTKKVLEAFRGLHQSYADSQIWSSNIYTGLKRTIPDYMKKAIVPIKVLRNQLDPYSFALDLESVRGKYSSDLFITALSLMDSFYFHFGLALTYPIHVNIFAKDFASACSSSDTDKTFLIQLFEKKLKLILEAESQLKNAGYEHQEILCVRTLAMDTGKAITEFFKGFI